MKILTVLALCVAALAGCRTTDDHWRGAAERGKLPADWLTPDHYRCLKAFHMHQTLTQDYGAVIAACRSPAAAEWAPAQTALALASLSAAVGGSPLPAGALTPDDAFAALRAAAMAGETVALSTYGGLLGGEEGRRLVRRAAEQGILHGATWMATNGGAPITTESQREDAYWASYLIELAGVVRGDSIRQRFESGPEQLPTTTRQRLAADARSVRMGPAAATPVAPGITFDVEDAVSERAPLKDRDGKPVVFLRVLDPRQSNPLNRGLARILADDPEVERAVRAHMAKSPWLTR
ncbi:hypothetical protein [Magnetospirillum aberrantis]|uniref:Lipoprotein n=1 Tax=Magnetospirillum aberrantis SpK TaxID=908842 RepID=A0A7C9QWA0_9PROT|nr:hypothetical protein [Magnetospirillum aberrantis]NFV81661.1 hypothetical protein [Magnetospirillum aberrantis SpK]